MIVRRFALASSFALVCSCASPAQEAPAPTAVRAGQDDPIARVDLAMLVRACDTLETPPGWPPVPVYVAPTGPTYALSVYTAHPDDEAMYAGGTISALTARGWKVSLAPMSHGEGGRLLVANADGGSELVERRDVTWQQVSKVRDPEMAEAARRMGADLVFLNEASQRADFGWTTSCADSLAHWDKSLNGGLRGVITKMVADIRRRKPLIVLTLDPRDDPHPSHHGHHKAVGVLAELSARLAADPRIAGNPHTVAEVLTMAPGDQTASIVVPVDAHARRHALDAHASQFWPKDLDGFGMRPDERFVVRWRATGGPPAPKGSALFTLLERP